MIKEFFKYKNIERTKKLLKEFENLNLNLYINDYAIFGSGPLGIRGLSYPDDLDIIIKKDKWIFESKDISIGNIEFFQKWPSFNDNEYNELINNYEIINSYPFVKLEYVLQYKLFMNRKKDQYDIKILKKLIS